MLRVDSDPIAFQSEKYIQQGTDLPAADLLLELTSCRTKYKSMWSGATTAVNWQRKNST